MPKSFQPPSLVCDASCDLNLNDADVIDVADIESHRLVFASLYTYADEKDESEFQKIHLPAICITAPDLYNIFYQTKLKRFSPFVLNRLIGSLDKAPIVNTVLANFESATGRDRSSLTAQQKILLRQEMSTQKINSRIQRIVHMDNEDFIASLCEEDMWFDKVDEVAPVEADEENEIEASDGTYAYRNLRTSIEIHIFSESLQQGIILVVQFVVTYSDGDEFPLAEYPITAITYFSSDPTSVPPKCGMCVTYNAPVVPEVPAG